MGVSSDTDRSLEPLSDSAQEGDFGEALSDMSLFLFWCSSSSSSSSSLLLLPREICCAALLSGDMSPPVRLLLFLLLLLLLMPLLMLLLKLLFLLWRYEKRAAGRNFLRFGLQKTFFG